MESINIGPLDSFDKKIIEQLSTDGRLTITELAKRVGLSKTPCQVRFKRLVEQGYISGFRAVINYQLLDVGHIAFAEVRLSDTRHEALESFNEAVQEIREVEQCHMIAGSFDYLLKVRTRDINAYRHVLGERISSLPYVSNTSTFVAMQTIKDSGN